jgi:predicted dehydrogenase
MRRLKLGVVGVGHLGQIHARIIAGLPGAELAGVTDANPDQAEQVAARHNTQVFSTHHELLAHVDGVCVVTPTTFHHSIACESLRRGIATLVEKPLAMDLSQADELVELTSRHGAILQVGHIERFNPAYEELRKRPMRPKFVECERHGTYTGRSTDIGAVLDLMIHDLDLLLDLVGESVTEVDAVGAAVFGGHEDLVNARLRFSNGCLAHLTASRMSPNPKRKLRAWAPEGYAGIDFIKRHLTLVQPSEELRRREFNPERYNDPSQRAVLQGQVFKRFLKSIDLDCNRGDQLTDELEHFANCIRSGSRPRVAAEEGRAAIALAMRVLDSLKQHRWENRPDGPTGPDDLPTPAGPLLGDRSRAA